MIGLQMNTHITFMYQSLWHGSYIFNYYKETIESVAMLLKNMKSQQYSSLIANVILTVADVLVAHLAEIMMLLEICSLKIFQSVKSHTH